MMMVWKKRCLFISSERCPIVCHLWSKCSSKGETVIHVQCKWFSTSTEVVSVCVRFQQVRYSCLYGGGVGAGCNRHCTSNCKINVIPLCDGNFRLPRMLCLSGHRNCCGGSGTPECSALSRRGHRLQRRSPTALNAIRNSF